MKDVFMFHRGTAPLLVSLPHVGREIPDEMKPRFVPSALAVEDTDWHLAELYAFVIELGASMIVPRYSRYVIDLNRPPMNTPMYPGFNNTELCPTRSFMSEPLYRQDRAPNDVEIAKRLDAYWRPYHQALGTELARLKARNGYALLWDGHSIKSRLPWMFEGKLPDLNLGTADGASCAPALRSALERVLERQAAFTHVTDGRFKGGYITRHYGRPEAGVHAVQLEMCWSCYMVESTPYAIDAARAAVLEPVLRELISTALGWRPGA